MIDWWGLIITVSFGVSVSLLILTAYAAPRHRLINMMMIMCGGRTIDELCN